jgi:hypothetical protein
VLVDVLNERLEERKTALASPISRRLVATFSPMRVFPAPGTPVTNTIALCRPILALSMTSSTAFDVTVRFFAPASLREIASTLWRA